MIAATDIAKIGPNVDFIPSESPPIINVAVPVSLDFARSRVGFAASEV
jgi:hypothetical protein